MASVFAPNPARTVATNHTYLVMVSGRSFASVDRAHFELRRHMGVSDNYAPVALSGLGYGAGKVGRPNRAWSTTELANQLATLKAVQDDAARGYPITLTVESYDDAASFSDKAGDLLATGVQRARNVVSAAGDAASDALGGLGVAAGIGLGTYVLYMILVAVVFWIFRKPLMKLIAGAA